MGLRDPSKTKNSPLNHSEAGNCSPLREGELQGFHLLGGVRGSRVIGLRRRCCRFRGSQIHEDLLLHQPARLEMHDLLCRNIHGCSGSGISGSPGRPVLDFENSELTKLKAVPIRQLVDNLIDERLDNVFGYESSVYDRTVDAHIKSLRKKLGKAKNYIETVRGAGYRFKET